MLIGGHRGFSEEYPHNSWEGFSAALPFSDFFELDVRRTADGVRVLSHDPEVAGVTLLDAPWSEVCQIDLGGGVRPITLDELLGRIGDIPIDIELKNLPWNDDYDASMEHPLAAAALARPQDMITSFSWETMYAIRTEFPDVTTGLLFRDPITVDEGVRAALEGGHNLVVPHFSLLESATQVEAIHKAGLDVAVWTVNSSEDVKRMADFGVDWLVTDHPPRVRTEMNA